MDERGGGVYWNVGEDSVSNGEVVRERMGVGAKSRGEILQGREEEFRRGGE